MRLLIRLAWRNLWRNRRRSILTVAAIAFSTLLTVFFRGMALGTWEQNVRQTVEMLSGYLQVQRAGYEESPTLQKALAYPGPFPDILRSADGVTAFAPRITADGLLSVRRNSAGTMIFGIDPAAERSVSRFHERVRNGRMIAPGSVDEVVVGATLLENLKASVGDTVVLLAQGYDGVMGNQRYRIVGALKMGIPELDGILVLMDLRAAQELLAMEGRINVIAVGARGLDAVEPVRRTLSAAIAGRGLVDVAVLRWDEVLPELKQAMEFDIINDNIFFGILLVIVAFGILNTVLMSVTERFREFGISLAMGMRSSALVRLVVLETMLLTFMGALVGAVPGYMLSLITAANPIMLGGDLAQYYEEYGFQPQIIGSTDGGIAITVIAAVLFLGVLACLYPARRVARLEPLGGIRHT